MYCLKELSDEKLTEILKNKSKQSSAALIELENRHSGIYYKIINKFIPSSESNSGINIDKTFLFDNKKYLLYTTALKFNPDKNIKFATFFGNNARYFCLNHINKNKKYINFENSDFENIFEYEKISDEIKEKIDSNIIDEILNLLKEQDDERLFQIFKLRYFGSENEKITPWNQIYKKIKHKNNKDGHITIQGCINIHNKGLDIIKNYLKNKNE